MPRTNNKPRGTVRCGLVVVKSLGEAARNQGFYLLTDPNMQVIRYMSEGANQFRRSARA
jgi:hypothetical protein